MLKSWSSSLNALYFKTWKKKTDFHFGKITQFILHDLLLKYSENTGQYSQLPFTSRWADCGTSRQHSTPTLCDTLVCVQLGPFSSSCLSLFPPEVQRTARSQCLVSLTVSAQRLWSRQNVLSFHQSFFHLIKFFTKWHSIANKGTSLVLQWLRIHLPMQGTWVRSLVWEDSTSHRAAEPMNHNY